jgi:polyisoprenoid-binding protein YceI
MELPQGITKQKTHPPAMKKNLFFTIIAMTGLIVPQAIAAELEVDQTRSRIQVEAKATGHAFTGTLEKYTVSASGDATTNEPDKLALSWDFNDLKTGDAKRDQEMIKWLGGGKPAGSFTFLKTWTEGGKTHAQGALTINRVSKTIAFPYSVKREGDWATIDGSVKIDYQNFSLPVIKAMMVMTVDPKLVINFHLVGKVR